ncbi:hypothetical protein [Micromonospora lupini]|uniref:hypothetical protein n=1 Tax=Micromonospora lupini TaxID=285679 RepID=UPI0031D6CBD2
MKGMAWEWIAPVVTGVVGVAGIAGSVWTAASARRSQSEVLRRQHDGESRRQHQQDKQALYIKILTELTNEMELSLRCRVLRDKVDPTEEQLTELRSLHDQHLKQMLLVGRLRAEVAVIAGPAMTDEFRKAVRTVGNVGAMDAPNVSGVNAAVAELAAAMHSDLMAQVNSLN